MNMRKFYLLFRDKKVNALRSQLSWSHYRELLSIKNFDENTYQEYLDKHNIIFIALAKYFSDKIPNIFSIKFEDKNQKCILYADEIENFN